MGHNIAKTNGKSHFASVREIAWHGLGQIVDNTMTSEDAIREAGLDYEIKKYPLYASIGEQLPQNGRNQKLSLYDHESHSYNRILTVNDKYATVREDTKQVLGTVGSRYEIIQNWEAFKFFDAIVGEGAAIYETAGALGIGETIFITAKLPQDVIIKDVDKIDQYLLLTMSHDGTAAVKAMFTPIRVVCNNTLSAALYRAKNQVSIRHSANYQEQLQQAHKLLGIIPKFLEDFTVIYSHMSDIKLNDAQLDAFICDSLGLVKNEEGKFSTRATNIRKDVMDYIHSDKGGQQMEICKGTLYGAYNGITGYFNNVKSFKNEKARGENILVGTASTKIEKSFNIIKNIIDCPSEIDAILNLN